MAHTKLPEIKTLRRTMLKWSEEILNYFKTKITNARTEGFNNLAKLYQKRASDIRTLIKKLQTKAAKCLIVGDFRWSSTIDRVEPQFFRYMPRI